MTNETLDLLTYMAELRFGKERVQELRTDLEALAADLTEIRSYPLTIEDEL